MRRDMFRGIAQCLVLFIGLHVSPAIFASGSSIDKVYDPYVQLLEKEFEYRTLYEQDSDSNINGRQRHLFGYGQSLSDRFFAEIYLSGTDEPESGFSLDGYEAELKWQLTEQGEFSNDWGVLFELEKSRNKNAWETSSKLIVVHEWPQWILTGNLSLIYEWGSDVENEWKSELSSQLRYRIKESIEPAIELYLAKGTQGIGPVMTGLWRIGSRRKINWKFGVIFGIDTTTADANWKLNAEYEF